MEAKLETVAVSKTALWAGRIMCVIMTLFMLMDAVMKVVNPAMVREGMAKAGYPPGSTVWIGLSLLVSTILFAIPPTQILGALLITAYLGGATATNVQAGQPWIFPALFGVFMWIGLLLCDGRLRRILPISCNCKTSKRSEVQ
jgi:hypothetical protein